MLRFTSRLLSALAVSSALLACSDDEQTFTPPTGDAGSAGTSAGASGTSGQAGTSAGSAGTAGTAGKGGSSGTSGQGGAGASGASGQSGAAGATAGTAGAAGATAGAAGDAGAAGATGGAAGDAGAAGSTGGTDAGGAAGTAGAAGGSAGTGGAGGAPASACLPASDYAGVLTLGASTPFCVTRVHKTSLPSVGNNQIVWGGHDGPLSTDTNPDGNFATSDPPAVRRWTLGTDVHAALTATATTVTVPGLPSTYFFGPAVDVPELGLTTITYTGSGAISPGEIVAFDTALTTVKSRAAVNGFYSGVALPASLKLGKSRMLFTALSPVTVTASATGEGGFYALDICDSTTLLKADCGTSLKKGTWAGGSSGPVAVDAVGNTFAALSAFGGNQEVHGFSTAESSSATATTGKVVLTNTDFSTSIAASAPTADTSGLVVVQTSDAASFSAKPALVYSYISGNDGVTATAIASGGFQAVKAGASVAVFGADDGTIWVAVDGDGAAYFVALARK